MVRLYTAVTALSELYSEGQKYDNISWEYPNFLQQGDRGRDVRHLQYMLAVLAEFIPRIPAIDSDGIFGPATRQAVLAAQEYFGLPQTGAVNEVTWDLIYDQFAGIENTAPGGSRRSGAPLIPNDRRPSTIRQFPGEPLRTGTRDPQNQEGRS